MQDRGNAVQAQDVANAGEAARGANERGRRPRRGRGANSYEINIQYVLICTRLSMIRNAISTLPIKTSTFQERAILSLHYQSY